MEMILKGEPKEIAALVLAIQERQSHLTGEGFDQAVHNAVLFAASKGEN